MKFMRVNLRKVAVLTLVFLMMALSGCGNSEAEIVEIEIGDIIFENDSVKITAVSTDEYLEVFHTQKIRLAYFASDGFPVILDLHGAALSIFLNDEKLYDDLDRSILTAYEADEQTEITDMLAEFYVAENADGFVMYYEIFNEYDEKEDDTTIIKYLNLKAFKVEFKKSDDLEENFI